MGSGRRGQAALIRQHSRRQHQQMLAQDEEISRRRNRQRLGTEAEKKSRLLRRLKLLYFPTVLFLCLGVLMILFSIIQGLGEGTVFWEQREKFHIVGPVILVVGVLFLFISVGVVTHVSSKERTREAIASLAIQVGQGNTDNFVMIHERKHSFYRQDSSSIPMMGFEDEEYFANNVTPKPIDFREEEFRLNNCYELSVSKSAINNNIDKIDFSKLVVQSEEDWQPENLQKKHTTEGDHNAHSPLSLTGRSQEKQPTAAATRDNSEPFYSKENNESFYSTDINESFYSTDNKESFDLLRSDVWELPESII